MRGKAIGQHQAMNPAGAESIDSHRGTERGVDAAGKSHDDAGKPFLST